MDKIKAVFIFALSALMLVLSAAGLPNEQEAQNGKIEIIKPLQEDSVEEEQKQEEQAEQKEDTREEQSEQQKEPLEQEKSVRKIKVLTDGAVMEMDLEEYIVQVVAGEVYPTFEPEALKAQAVAARTYLMYKINGGGCSRGGDVCTDYAHCQAFKSFDKMLAEWKGNYQKYLSSIQQAVNETEGEIIKYNGAPICALYHSSSVDKTEDCVSVFGGNHPYLVSVESPIGEQEYSKTVTFTKNEFIEKVNKAFNLKLEGIDIKIVSRTSAGRVGTVKLGDKSVKATALRTALSLRSTDFVFEKDSESITFTVYGYGHGVGMSQQGAQLMAKEGKTYKEILTHYYTGTTVEQMDIS
ncbi:MAG: stage II sporulation protein D [Clostridia bacterium]|nr:stage II sporulation protein D [Clostridia bacterium]